MNFCVLKKKAQHFVLHSAFTAVKSSHRMYPHSTHNYNISTPFLLTYQAISGANILCHRPHHLHPTFLSTRFLLYTWLCNGLLHSIGYINQCLDIFSICECFNLDFHKMPLLCHCSIQRSVWLQILWKIRFSLPNIALPTCSVTPGGLAVMPIVEFWRSGSGWRAQTLRICRVS